VAARSTALAHRGQLRRAQSVEQAQRQPVQILPGAVLRSTHPRCALDGLPVEACGVAVDVYHQNIEEKHVGAAIRSARGRIALVQVCANDRGTPGEDHLDWPDITTALTEADYTGPLCIESFTGENAGIATAASVWRPLAPTQDALAVDGLAFLRGLTDTR
jgi:D-psicose/D-tagatose/L-ribulose 3-epimerase